MSVSNVPEQRRVTAPERAGTPDGDLQPQVTRARVEDLDGARLFPSDPRAAFVLLNEARYLAIQGVFGVRRDRVNLMTVIAALTLAEAAHARTGRLRRRVRGLTRTDLLLADGLLNALGQEIAGPVAREMPAFAAVIGAAAIGAVARRVLHQSSRDIKAASHRITLSVRQLLGEQAGRIPAARARLEGRVRGGVVVGPA